MLPRDAAAALAADASADCDPGEQIFKCQTKPPQPLSLAYSSTLGPSEAEFFRGSQAEGPSQIGLEKSKVQGVMTGYIQYHSLPDSIINDSEVGLINTL